ncbi:uncharacterized protein LOC141900276 [Tubulanus polymorphus]|uniref:uncharacterized protein LOC141900276 n=1 Tax=Tubulanus polymorphus TaxID=672921 RepID=UPI003DA30131
MRLNIILVILPCLTTVASVTFKLSDIPEKFRDKFSEASVCKNPAPDKYVQKTRTKIVQRVISETVKSGTTSCGFLGTAKCSVYTLKYKTVPTYSIETYDVLEKQPCAGKLGCPSGEFSVHGLCISMTVLRQPEIMQLLKDLNKKDV